MKWKTRVLVLLLGLLPVYAYGDVALQRVFENITFKRPLAILADPVDSRVWYVVEQAGRILRLDEKKSGVKSTVFVDISDRVESGSNETGLLGLAFGPDINKKIPVYLSYTRTEKSSASVFDQILGNDEQLISTLSRFTSADGGKTLDKSSEQKLLQVSQPYSNHNGGNIQFGPDGYLYYGLGDGGSGGDPEGNGQNKQTLLGSMLRIDVSDGMEGYAVPADNPFANKSGKPEIFAYGLRNPWRWSFDRQTGDLWVADVGQNRWEEVNHIKRGGNYGWNFREGKHCFSDDCKQAKLIDPVAEYSHDEGCSITGGYVYRGKNIPALNGVYLYGDYCSGMIWGFDADKQDKTESRVLLNTDLNISSFGEDQSGEIFVIDLKGRIFKVVNK